MLLLSYPLAFSSTLSTPSLRFISRARPVSSASTSRLERWPDAFENSLVRDLRGEPLASTSYVSRQVYGAHFTMVRPTVASPLPLLVAYSTKVAEMLGLQREDCESEEFLRIFSGSPPASYDCWATAYGASFTGSYGGQRGDGRAISIGQCGGFEIQLKGAGITPYSRQFDGRAVLRSSVREFLASEAMAALGVPTTRSLCVVSTGEQVMRRWYDDKGRETVLNEHGAVGARVASSFLRFGQMELFFQRGEMELLRELAEHALRREFSSIQEEKLSRGLTRMFDEICKRQARLMSEWLRVGYCQGNMNSDNSALSGITLDYGPFAFMEKYVPQYNPWVGGGVPYSFIRQPHAAAINLSGLAAVFIELLKEVGKKEGLSSAELKGCISEVEQSVSSSFVENFHAAHDENCRAKLGLLEWDAEAQALWGELCSLMTSSSGDEGIDFTNLFRCLSTPSPAEQSLILLQPAAFETVDTWPQAHKEAWIAWLSRYWARVEADGRPFGDRLTEMEAVNPKFILRNWMAAEAYEAAESGNFEVVRELHDLLSRPYDDQGSDAFERWGGLTPQWARGKPGLAFMS